MENLSGESCRGKAFLRQTHEWPQGSPAPRNVAVTEGIIHRHLTSAARTPPVRHGSPYGPVHAKKPQHNKLMLGRNSPRYHPHSCRPPKEKHLRTHRLSFGRNVSRVPLYRPFRRLSKGQLRRENKNISETAGSLQPVTPILCRKIYLFMRHLRFWPCIFMFPIVWPVSQKVNR